MAPKTTIGPPSDNLPRLRSAEVLQVVVVAGPLQDVQDVVLQVVVAGPLHEVVLQVVVAGPRRPMNWWRRLPMNWWQNW